VDTDVGPSSTRRGLPPTARTTAATGQPGAFSMPRAKPPDPTSSSVAARRSRDALDSNPSNPCATSASRRSNRRGPRRVHPSDVVRTAVAPGSPPRALRALDASHRQRAGDATRPLRGVRGAATPGDCLARRRARRRASDPSLWDKERGPTCRRPVAGFVDRDHGDDVVSADAVGVGLRGADGAVLVHAVHVDLV
jgi:hypothetical protein